MPDMPDGGPGMLASMTPEPPGRSLVGAEFLQPERDGQIRVLLTCDCGTATDLTVLSSIGVGPHITGRTGRL